MRSLLLLFLVSGCATCVALTKGGSTLKKAVVRGRLVARGDRMSSNAAFEEFLPKLAETPLLGENIIHTAGIGLGVAAQNEAEKAQKSIRDSLKPKFQKNFDDIRDAMFGGKALQKCSEKECEDVACADERIACQDLNRGLVEASQKEAGCKMYEVKFTLKTVHPGEPDTPHGPGWYFIEEFGQTEADKLAHDGNWGAYSTKTDKKYRFTKPEVPWGIEGTQVYDCSPPVKVGNEAGDCLIVMPAFGSTDDPVYGPDGGTKSCKQVKACWFKPAALV